MLVQSSPSRRGCVSLAAAIVVLLSSRTATQQLRCSIRTRRHTPDFLTTSLPRAPTLLFMRHAQSSNNGHWYRKGILGLRDPPLSAAGVQQARRAARALSHLHVDLVFSSHLQRAMQTAALVFGTRVYVAPYAGELARTGTSCFFSPGICAHTRAAQRAEMGDVVSAQMNWSLVGGEDGRNDDAAMGPPSLQHFLSWMWNQTLVQNILMDKGANATIALVSHGNLLEWEALDFCWSHPTNMEVYSTPLMKGMRLPLKDVNVAYEDD
ncbi:hypothetical protein AB1Y20_011296 [Prymnesium parvum]|uniref:Phosphoglycerate mutase (2,3-diphosphoglycerate-dependent) n=1 Tax=Prymnesium parvum TaxID=97485 RepID=A0AB34IMF3_PRYPA